MKTIEIEADVLVIGGGLAGTWAALRAKEFVDKVVLVDKARVSRSGATTSAAGVMLCPAEEDDLNLWMREIVERGEYMNDQDWLRLMLEEQIDRIQDLASWGLPVERDAEGKIARQVGRGHEHTRLLMFHGKKLMETMRKQVLAMDVELLERVMVTDLLTSDGQHPSRGSVVGAVGIHPRTGDYYLFKAKAIVLSTGSMYPRVGGFFVDNITGDSPAIGFRAGAELIGMEFALGGPLGLWDRRFYTVGYNMFVGHGAYFVNGQEERFMAKFNPVLKERVNWQGLVPSFCKEAVEGRGPTYADMTHLPPETIERFRRVIPHSMRVFDRSGIDLTKQRVTLEPILGLAAPSGEGGIKVNLYCEANLPGLYAAGAASKMLAHGTYSVGGVNLAWCNVSGHRAGEYAARYAQAIDGVEIKEEQAKALQVQTTAPLGKKGGIKPDQVFEDIRRLNAPVSVSVAKNKERIMRVLSEIDQLKEKLSDLEAPDHHELVKAHEARNYVQCSELAHRAALERTESRYYQFREDYPERDDRDWLKWIVQWREGDEIMSRLEPIPVYRYPIRPEKLDKKPAAIPIHIK